MDGLLVIDKPVGPTSHDVVARVRRVLHEQRVGHTGTLDPMACGVLPLVIGRATRLAQFLSTSRKRYEATIRLGVSTDTHDATGRRAKPAYSGAMPSRDDVDRALDQFRGTFLQQPPAFSAKKIGGHRSHTLARNRARATSATVWDVSTAAVLPAPVAVSVHAIELLSSDGDLLTVRITCSAGFYVRSLAHDLGRSLGTGAHLSALKRTEAAGVTLTEAVPLAEIDDEISGVPRAMAALIPLAAMLPNFPAVALTDEGSRRAARGRDLGPSDLGGTVPAVSGDRRNECFRLLDPFGNLVAVARPSATPGLLHPAVVLV